MGFTLAFGAMFSKVWRVHRFTTKAKTDPKVTHAVMNFLSHENALNFLFSPLFSLMKLSLLVTCAEESGAMEVIHDGIGSLGC